MTSSTRRKIEELIVRYELEPELDDLYVEGSFDKELISHFLSTNKIDRAIYEIDSVDVPQSMLNQFGLTSGNKQRVIALAKHLSDSQVNANYICLVDKDLDHWFNSLEEIPGLRWSCYCSAELHFLTKEILHAILVVMCKAKISDIEAYGDSLSQTLSNLYALRLADRAMNLNMNWPDFSRYISFNEGEVSIDLSRYCDAVLLSNGKANQKEEFMNCVNQWIGALSGDCRDRARGHDFTNLLALSIKKLKGIKDFASSEALERIFILMGKSVETIAKDCT